MEHSDIRGWLTGAALFRRLYAAQQLRLLHLIVQRDISSCNAIASRS
jgi:hypothetical protein